MAENPFARYAPASENPFARYASSGGNAAPESKGAIENALEPITSYPGTYAEMNRESRDQIARGVEQLKSGVNFATTKTPEGMSPADQAGAGPVNLVKGIGNVAAGGVNFVTSPINAALRTVVGRPIENTTGIPKELPEFAAGVALPIPSRIPLPKMAPRTPGVLSPTTERLFEEADKGYEAARANPTRVPPEDVQGLAKNITADLKASGARDYLEPKTHRAITELNVETPADFNDIYSVRKALNRAAADPSERAAARQAIEKIDEFIAPRFPETAAARENYAAAKRSELLEGAVDRATRAAGAANSGQNFENALRRQIKAIRNSDRLSRGFSANELANMDEIVKGSTAANLARGLGNMAGGGGGIGATITGALSKGVAPVFGYALKKIGNAVTSNEVNKLIETVQSRAPAAKAASASLRQWSEAAQAFEAEPSVRAFVRMSIASRNLSNNLHGVGMAVQPNDLLRSLQGVVKSRAEDEQPQPEGVVQE